MPNFEAFVAAVKFDSAGLVAALDLDAANGEPAMLAWMNREALEKTLDTGVVTYWSRSRKKLWVKGETSGNIQTVREIRFDCDADCLLCRVDQKGAACHEGYRSCFFRVVAPDGGDFTVDGERVFIPGDSHTT